MSMQTMQGSSSSHCDSLVRAGGVYKGAGPFSCAGPFSDYAFPVRLLAPLVYAHPNAAKSTPDGGHVKHFPAEDAAAHLVLEVPNVQGAVWDSHLQRPLLWACVCACVFAHVCMRGSTSASLTRVTCMHVQARDHDVRSVAWRVFNGRHEREKRRG